MTSQPQAVWLIGFKVLHQQVHSITSVQQYIPLVNLAFLMVGRKFIHKPSYIFHSTIIVCASAHIEHINEADPSVRFLCFNAFFPVNMYIVSIKKPTQKWVMSLQESRAGLQYITLY